MRTGSNRCRCREKTLIWHLSQAAIAGRDIYIDQKHPNALDMRAVLEAIVTHPQGVDPATLGEIQRYTKLFWINNGPYNNLTAQKFVLTITPQAFAAAAKSAEQAGARFPGAEGESLDALLTRLQPMFFDPKVDPIVTNKTPGPGEDILTASANNLYCERQRGGPRGLHGEVPAELAAREAERPPGRGGLPHQRALRAADSRNREAPRGGYPLRLRADGEGTARAGAVVPHR